MPRRNVRFWSKLGIRNAHPGGPIYPGEGTSSGSLDMSEKRHEPAHAPQKTTALFDHLVGTGEQCRGQVETERLRGRLIEDKIEFSG